MIQAALNLDHNTLTCLERFFPEVVAKKGLPVVRAEDVRRFCKIIESNASFLALAGKDLTEVPYQIARGLSKCT